MRGKQRILNRAETGCYLNIEAQPGANESGIVGVDQWRNSIKIAIVSPPSAGKANVELIGIMEGIFPEARGNISLTKGGKSHSKRIFIPLDEGTIRKRLGLKDDQ